MSFKAKLFSLFTLVFAVTVFSGAAIAQEATTSTPKDDAAKGEKFGRKGHGRGMHGGKFGGRNGGMRGLRGIELTDAQKEQINAIREANKPDQAAMEEFRRLRQAKRDGTLTAEQTERMKVLKDQARQKGEAVRLQIEGILTPEQKQQIEQRKQEWQKRREERRQLRQQAKPTTDTSMDN
jgi:protein CpxP